MLRLVDQLMPRPSNTEERRRQIVAGLRHAMATDGYQRATIGRIAKAAGLTPGLVHYHFDNKQQILLSLVEQTTSHASDRIESNLAKTQAPRPRVAGFLEALLGRGPGADPDRVACWALIGAEAVRQREVRQLWQEFIRRSKVQLSSLLREVCRTEGRSSKQVSAMAAALLATVEGYMQIGAAAPGLVPKGTAARMAVRMAQGLIDSQPMERER